MTVKINADTSDGLKFVSDTSGEIDLQTNGTTKVHMDSSGNVGIGTTSPSGSLHINTSSANILIADTDDSNGSYSRVRADASGNLILEADVGNVTGSSGMRFLVDNTEHMRLNSTGEILFGKTSNDFNVAGGTFNDTGAKNGALELIADGVPPLALNRKSSHGIIINIHKDAVGLGTIGTSSTTGRIYVGGGNMGISLGNSGRGIPTNALGVGSDNQMDWGQSNYRWDDIYATNGTIQTSDRNEKQSIESLTTDEMNVAKRLSSLFKTFKFNSSVEEKGDNARTHTGIIAQDVQQAFTDEGLDASNYSLFISSTWYENSDGEEVESGTEGATEKTRLGIRYPELLSFIQAYNDQRFTELEARITALENN